MEEILADLAARYPDGYVCFSRAGQRLDTPVLYQRKTGYSVNVNGAWHFYSRIGIFISAGHSNGGMIGVHYPPRLRQAASRRRQHSSQGPVANARLARGLARIADEHREIEPTRRQKPVSRPYRPRKKAP